MRIKIGDVYGKLKVIEEAGRTDKNKRLVLCQCECTNKFIIQSEFIRKLKYQQCKKCSLKSISGCKHHNWSGYEEITGTFWKSIKRGAKTRNLIFEITIEDAWDKYLKQNKKCALTGIELTFGNNKTASLDRIDSSKGYVINNIQWLHKTVNNMKWSFQQEDFVNFCELITNKVRLRETLSYDDVSILPRYSDIPTRAECDTSSYVFKDLKVKLPIISSPMATVTYDEMAIALYRMGSIGCLHRFESIESQIDALSRFKEETGIVKNSIICAVGAKGDYLERVTELNKLGCNLFCIDTAHGETLMVKEAINKIKSEFDVKIMAGNIATANGAQNLINWGADSLRVSIGSGAMCETKIRTGIGVPTISCIMDCVSVAKEHNIPVIADGGTRLVGDVCKGLAAGASGIMLGSLLSGTRETPGDVIRQGNWPNELLFKKYQGSASEESKKSRGEESKNIEGNSTLVPYKGKVERIINDIEEGLKSSMSYIGSRTIEEFHRNAELIRVTNAGVIEAHPHGMK